MAVETCLIEERKWFFLQNCTDKYETGVADGSFSLFFWCKVVLHRCMIYMVQLMCHSFRKVSGSDAVWLWLA